MQKAYFAGGCFWCITPSFRDTAGVTRVVSGYSGGTTAEPTYAEVKAQKTGHRETILVEYDETVTSFAALTDLFLSQIDPFDEGGQFIDRGHSYTTCVYTQNDAERETAEAALSALEAESGRKPAVAVEAFTAFWPAEEYHQDYDLKNPEAFAKELKESGRVKE